MNPSRDPDIPNREDLGQPPIIKGLTNQETGHDIPLTRKQLEQAVVIPNCGFWDLPLEPGNTCIPDQAFISPQLKKFIGFEPDEFPNSVSAWHERIHPEDQSRVEKQASEYVNGKSEQYDVQYRIKHRNGNWLWIHSLGHLQHNNDNESIRFSGMDWNITPYKNLEKKLQQKQSEFRNLFENAPVAYVTFDSSGILLKANNRMEQLTGFTSDQLKSCHLSQVLDLDSEDQTTLKSLLNEFNNHRETVTGQLNGTDSSGKTRCVRVTLKPYTRDSDQASIGLASLVDITEKQNIVDLLEKKEQQYRSFIEASPDIIYQLDPDGTFAFVSSQVESLGFSPGELEGKHFSCLLKEEDVGRVSRVELLQYYTGLTTGPDRAPRLFDERRTGNRATRDLELQFDLPDEQYEGERYFVVNSSGIYDTNNNDNSNRFLGTVGFIREITRTKQTELRLRETKSKLEQMSYRDPLTGIANRRYFSRAGTLEWSRMERQNKPLGLIMFDLDHFKLYNDALGHQKGDEALQRTANIMDQFLKRSGDVLTRYGGEEFAAILPDTDLSGAYNLALEIREKIEDHKIAHPNSNVSPYVTVSAGVASVVPTQNCSIQELLNKADEALYRAKSNGRNRVEKGTR
ncbi:MAG: diguanylate cyclase [bacterium]